MPEVKLSLAEVDAYRDEIKELKKERDELLFNQKRVIIKKQPVSGNVTINDLANWRYSGVRFIDRKDWKLVHTAAHYSENKRTMNFKAAIREGLLEFKYDEVEDKVSFEGLDDTIQRIRQEEYSKVRKQLTDASDKLLTIEQALSLKDKEHSLQIQTMEVSFEEKHEKFAKEVKESDKENKEKFEILEKEFLDYKEKEESDASKKIIKDKLDELEQIKSTRIYKLLL